MGKRSSRYAAHFRDIDHWLGHSRRVDQFGIYRCRLFLALNDPTAQAREERYSQTRHASMSE
jgi:hypothetical protein